MKLKTKSVLFCVFGVTAYMLMGHVADYVEQREIPGLLNAPCSGWKEGWKREPELAGIAAAIRLSRVAGQMKWPEDIESTLEYARTMFSYHPCPEEMPEVSRAVEYPVPGWDCESLPNGVRPNTHHDRGKNWRNIPDDLVLLRATSTTGPERTLDFLWDGRIVERDHKGTQLNPGDSPRAE